MLQHVEEASFGIAARSLPPVDSSTSRLVEPSVHLGIEAEARQSALNVATLCLVEPDLVFGYLTRIDPRINGCQLVADGCTRTGICNICTDRELPTLKTRE